MHSLEIIFWKAKSHEKIWKKHCNLNSFETSVLKFFIIYFCNWTYKYASHEHHLKSFWIWNKRKREKQHKDQFHAFWRALDTMQWLRINMPTCIGEYVSILQFNRVQLNVPIHKELKPQLNSFGSFPYTIIFM